ncbi:MAG: phosphodiesterase [Lachnospiraceae bacterium]
MKLLIASDIHGSAYYCRKLLEAYEREEADRLVLLGDLLYHGPRNDLPEGYAPKEVLAMLNERKEEILCVRGNCDTEVDQMVLQFPILADYGFLYEQGHMIFLTHGHVFNEQNPPMLKKGDLLLHGHTHVPVCREHETYLCLNPGSVSIPKEGSAHSYLVYENGTFLWKELGGDLYMEYEWV